MNPQNEEIRIVLADDHEVVRQGLKHAIESARGMAVVGQASDGQAAIAQVEALRPQIAILDVDMPEMDGFTAARAIRALQSPPEIIFLTVHRERDFLKEAFETGAKGYVLKDSAVSDILSAIQAVAAGGYYTSPSMTAYLIASSTPPGAPAKTGIQDLSPTERRILQLLADYRTSKQIAAELFISYRTVQTHRSNICQKLNLEGNHALMKFALDHKRDL